MAAQEDGTTSSSSIRAAGPPSPLQQEGAGGSGRGRHSNIYVRGLPEGCSEERLLTLVAPYGTVQSVRIYHAQKTMSYGAKCTFSFVKFSTVQEAQTAIAGIDGREFGGNVLQARLAVRDVDTAALSTTAKPPASDNVYCKNLPSSLRDSELRGVFSAYGTVVSCRILRQGNATGLGGAALIRFSNVDEASAAVDVLQGTRFPGSLHPLVIRFADTEEVKERKVAERQGLMGSEGDDPIARSKDRDRADRGRARERHGPPHGQDPSDLLHGSGPRMPGDAGPSSSGGIGRGAQGQGQGMRSDGHGAGGSSASGSGVPTVSFWQPPYNPFTSLNAPPRDMSAAAFMPSGGGGGGGGPGARYPGPEAFPWHAIPVYAMPHSQPLMMMAEASGAAPAAASGSELAAVAGGMPVVRASTEGHGRGMLGASGGESRGVSLSYAQVSDSSGGGGGGGGGTVFHHHMAEGHGGDHGAAASGSFVSVRYAPMVHPGYMHVPQVAAAQLAGSAMPVTGTFFPQGTSSVQMGNAPGDWRMAQGGAAGGGSGVTSVSAAVPATSAGPVPPFPAHVLHTVFCSNLPDQADRLYLYECFAPFGAILSVKLLKDKKGNSRRAAFINYADAAGASRAVAAMNNLPVGVSRHLQVSLRNPF